MPAPTDGHGNADWSMEETLLALELYQQCGGQIPGRTDPRVLALSELLRSLDIHPHDQRGESFRNPDGVGFKLQNLRNVATGKGLNNVSKVDRQVWEELGGSPDKTRATAERIRATMAGKIATTTGQVAQESPGALLLVLASLQPKSNYAAYKLVQQAGVDITPWSFNAEGDAIDPASNTYRNSRWAFGGGNEPTVLCIWWKGLTIEGGRIVHRGNLKTFRTFMQNALAAPGRSPGEAIRLRGKIDKSEEVERLLYFAYRDNKPVRLILLDGKMTEREEAASDSSIPDARALDPKQWWVEEYSPASGDFLLVRGVAQPKPKLDPFAGINDPSDDPAFSALMGSGSLSDTEKDALAKIRVGQGWFREQLIKRWGGCSVTTCPDHGVLIASHIVPWSKCTTKEERLSPANGLLLTPNLDKLFDKGLVTFNEKYEIVFSSKLSLGLAAYLHVDKQMRLRRKDLTDIQPFLERHRNEIFQKPAAPRL